jgi:hypothetical protein
MDEYRSLAAAGVARRSTRSPPDSRTLGRGVRRRRSRSSGSPLGLPTGHKFPTSETNFTPDPFRAQIGRAVETGIIRDAYCCLHARVLAGVRRPPCQRTGCLGRERRIPPLFGGIAALQGVVPPERQLGVLYDPAREARRARVRGQRFHGPFLPRGSPVRAYVRAQSTADDKAGRRR